MTVHLITGGARSGKSAYAEQLAAQAEAAGQQIIYIATSAGNDAEMQRRVALHRQQRPAHWVTVESPLQLAAALQQWDQAQYWILVDCLTVWLSNLLFSGDQDFPETGLITPPAMVAEQRAALLQQLAVSSADVTLVSNEVGLGIIPMGAVTRWYADEAGRLNQAVAKVAQQVTLVVAGLPLSLKPGVSQ
ncbi:bifunctional adenosylcobinamide kinase/adenosylcobinamide-phosphate guanylyltransferase [Undibacterium luofuense]|uniref:Bifunctional adenosylcobalamin biosynthesis protein n=1 Tax=Undibacterium luofuense TaxID=2828733 RepID=A0A941DQA9_9BURK|nr:bifunctional adenosylcobinamide kinase/adenosylcobinamide-phosphate guanylyltransferase [Undibacterium luofuense]MBR7782916.1 bifunctional adenosylcobinamide kinase/adenosylcobinamide-phosphate guanylyltransferase [Undibacterium luofuense]